MLDAFGVYSTVGSARSRSLSSSELHHTAGVEDPTPRGSNPTMSKRSLTDCGRPDNRETADSTPDSPGPPGLITSEPIFWPAAGNRIIARRATSPSGFE